MNESICSYSQGALQIASNEDEICKKSWNTPGLFWCFPPSPMSPKPAVNLFRGKIFPGPRTTKFPSSSIFPHPTFVLDTRPLTDFSLEPFLNLSLDRFTTRKNGPPLPSLLQLCVICSPRPIRRPPTISVCTAWRCWRWMCNPLQWRLTGHLIPAFLTLHH